MASTPFNQKCPITFEQRLDQSFVKGNKLQGGESSGAASISPRDLVKIGEVCQDLGSFLTRVVNTEGALSSSFAQTVVGRAGSADGYLDERTASEPEHFSTDSGEIQIMRWQDRDLVAAE